MRRLIELSRSSGAHLPHAVFVGFRTSMSVLQPVMLSSSRGVTLGNGAGYAQCQVPAPAPLEEVAMRVREPGHSEQRTSTAH